VLNKFKKY